MFLKSLTARLVLAWIGIGIGLSSQAAETVNPVAWGFFADGGGGPIDGTVDYSEVGSRVVAGYSTTTREIFRGIYEFDLAQNHSGAAGAVLQLRVISIYGPGSLSFQLYGYEGDGIATSADYSAGTFISAFSISGLGAYHLDVSSFVSSALQNGIRYLGFNIRPNGDPYVDDAAFGLGNPRDGSSSTLTIVPEPNATTLGAAALLVLIGRSGRKRGTR